MNHDPASRPEGDLPSPDHERKRARRRRQGLRLQRPWGHDGVQWGLALSGGGIRSATFCLGVLQALARRRAPGAGDGALLPQFDYLSTVSGGGYIGSFFTSLFVRGRLNGHDGQGAHPPETDETAARRAYEALLEDPPGRIHSDSLYRADRPGHTALAWLRDNGRYMMPTGAGDWMYGIAITLRNWLATQYVLATVIVAVLALWLSVRMGLAAVWPAWAGLEQSARANACQVCLDPSYAWWSPSWLWPGGLMLGLAVPLGLAYWFSHPARHDTLEDPPRYWTRASTLGALAGALLLGAAGVLWQLKAPGVDTGDAGVTAQSHVVGLLAGAGGLVGLGVLAFMVSSARCRDRSITAQRVLLTRWLSRVLAVVTAMAVVSLVETLAQSAHVWLTWHGGLSLGLVMGGLAWALRTLAPKLGDTGTGSLWSRVPVEVIGFAVGAALWIGIATFWAVLLLRVVWPDAAQPDATLPQGHALDLMAFKALGALALVAALARIVGAFPGFLNLSTLQTLYSARLTRAYLGASNFARFAPGSSAAVRDVAEPIKGDALSCEAVYANGLAPTHFINVCVNQTVSPGEQLVQHDRKGKPLVVAPGGVYFDRVALPLPSHQGSTELSYPLMFGEWVGVSGAAFSTGIGRGTGLGTTLALGFANVRLGRWWPGVPGTVVRGQAPAPQGPGSRDHWLRQWFTPQAYLIDELTGRFYAQHRRYQYLSDGGHFENTATYELLNPLRDRDVRLIVTCDCGADPDYEFQDLANLTRLARIDHGLEVRVNPAAPGNPVFQGRFARPEDFRRRADGTLPPRGARCGLLLDVVTTARTATTAHPAGTVVARIVWIKPVLIEGLQADLLNYQGDHPRFPQEPTSDQFFDEAQWESYRQLGLQVGLHLFPEDPTSADGQAFWDAVLDGLPGPSAEVRSGRGGA